MKLGFAFSVPFFSSKLISFGYATYLNELGEKRARPYFYDVFSVREGYKAPGGQLIFTDELKEKYFQNLDFSTTDQTFRAICTSGRPGTTECSLIFLGATRNQ